MLASLFGLGGPELILLVILVAFSIWMIVDCLKNAAFNEVQRILWLLIIVMVPCGAFVYLFVRRGKPLQPDVVEFYHGGTAEEPSGAIGVDPKDVAGQARCDRNTTKCERREYVRHALLIPVVPWVTYALLAVYVLFYVVGLVRGRALEPPSGLLIVVVDLLALYWAGPLIERMWGHWQFFAIYVSASVGASCVTLLLNWRILFVVPSTTGAFWGIMASMAVWIVLNREFIPSSLVSNWLRLLKVLFAVCLGIEFLRMLIPSFLFISGMGIGGAAFGAAMAVLIHVNRFGRGVWPWLAIAGALALPGLCIATLTWAMAAAR
jgi:hypothetical protein